MCTMEALILSKRKRSSSSSTVYCFVQIALTGKPAMSVGAKASNRDSVLHVSSKGRY